MKQKIVAVMTLVLHFFSYAYAHELAVTTAQEFGITGNPFDDKLLKMWTMIDMLRSIELNNHEKLSFLDNFVQLALEIYQIAQCHESQEHAAELLELTRTAFDDLYDMLVSDQIGFVRVMFSLTSTLVHQKQSFL